jgi:WD40 repeat protein
MTLDGHTAPVRGLAWLDARRLISADRSGRLLLWDLPSNRVLRSLQLDGAQDLALAPDRSWLLVIENSRLHKLALPSLDTMATLNSGSPLLSAAISQGGDRVAMSGRDGRVWLLDAGLQRLAELPRPSRDAMDLRFSPDGKTLLAGGWFRLLVWDLERRRLEERATEHLGKVSSVDISPDGEQWLSLGRITDSSVRLIDADSNRVLRRYQAHELCGWQARFSPDGRHAATAAEDGSIHIYDLSQPYRPKVPYAESDD